ncbi:CBS domain-containing protein [Candidatus Woesearchaeota archaeon]|nr:CBS domain-containing protein [Candidatus Woesearchaeota archaeon]
MFGLRKLKLGRQVQKGIENLLQTKVQEVMTDYVVTIAPDKSVTDAASVMVGEAVSGLVVEQEDRPIGVLTERDFITKVPLSTEVFRLKVKDIMSCADGEKGHKECKVAAVEKETTLAEARRLMAEKHIRKLVVLDKDGRIGGIVTQTDLSKAIYERVGTVGLIEAPFLVKDVMNPSFQSVEKKKGFRSAKQLMTKKNISALPVTEKGEIVGIFTEYDVVAQFYDTGGKLDIKELPEVMKTPVKAIPAGINIFDANMIMLFEKVRRLMVIEDGKVVGFLTQTDLVHSCYEYEEVLGKRLESAKLRAEDIVELKRKNSIFSEYAGEHLRAYTVKG